jgi:hypothetical protein
MQTNYNRPTLSRELIYRAIAYGCVTVADLAAYIRGIR